MNPISRSSVSTPLHKELRGPVRWAVQGETTEGKEDLGHLGNGGYLANFLTLFE